MSYLPAGEAEVLAVGVSYRLEQASGQSQTTLASVIREGPRVAGILPAIRGRDALDTARARFHRAKKYLKARML